MKTIDLRSDTVTRPTEPMKRAMMEAPVGDDVMGEDPTVNELEARVARLLGKEAALFTCSATQANQIAVGLHCRPGDELLVNSAGHIGIYEAGAPAALSGVTVRRIDAPRGMLTVADLEGKPWPDDPHYARTRLVCLENTTNMGGGFAYSLDLLREMGDWAAAAGLKIHLDGARLFNATVAGGYSPEEAARVADTVSLCFSKGLGCPMGAILAGTERDIHEARRIRKRLGGALRQAGIVAGAALYSLDHHVERLRDDHENALLLAEELEAVRAVSLPFGKPESNLLFFEIDPGWGTADRLQAELESRAVLIWSMGGRRMRAVTHLDVGREEVIAAAAILREILD